MEGTITWLFFKSKRGAATRQRCVSVKKQLEEHLSVLISSFAACSTDVLSNSAWLSMLQNMPFAVEGIFTREPGGGTATSAMLCSNCPYQTGAFDEGFRRRRPNGHERGSKRSASLPLSYLWSQRVLDPIILRPRSSPPLRPLPPQSSPHPSPPP